MGPKNWSEAEKLVWGRKIGSRPKNKFKPENKKNWFESKQDSVLSPYDDDDDDDDDNDDDGDEDEEDGDDVRVTMVKLMIRHIFFRSFSCYK